MVASLSVCPPVSLRDPSEDGEGLSLMGFQRLPGTPMVPPSCSPPPAALHRPKVVTGSEGGSVVVVQSLSRV